MCQEVYRTLPTYYKDYTDEANFGKEKLCRLSISKV